MPRKGYGTITVKVDTLQKFLKAKHNAKTTNPGMQNSRFLDLLLEIYKQ